MVLAFEEVLPTVYCIYDSSSENLIDLIAKLNNNYSFCHFTAAILAPLPRDTNKASPYVKKYTLSDLNLGLARFFLSKFYHMPGS